MFFQVLSFSLFLCFVCLFFQVLSFSQTLYLSLSVLDFLFLFFPFVLLFLFIFLIFFCVKVIFIIFRWFLYFIYSCRWFGYVFIKQTNKQTKKTKRFRLWKQKFYIFLLSFFFWVLFSCRFQSIKNDKITDFCVCKKTLFFFLLNGFFLNNKTKGKKEQFLIFFWFFLIFFLFFFFDIANSNFQFLILFLKILEQQCWYFLQNLKLDL